MPSVNPDTPCNPIFNSASTPSVSPETVTIFQEQNFTPPTSLFSLKNKVSSLEKMQKRLTDSKAHSTRDKIISLLAMSLAIGILAGGALGTYFAATSGLSATMAGSFVVVLLPLLSWFGTYGLTAFYNYHWSDDKEGVIPSCGYMDPCLFPFIGPFIPVFKTFGNVSEYQKSINLQNADIQQNLEETKKFFETNQEQCTRLLLLLNNAIAQTEQNLDAVKAQPIKSAQSETALSTQLDQLKKAQEELTAAITFFANPMGS